MSFDARGICGNCGERSLVTFVFRNGFESCPRCQAEYREQQAANRKDEERERQEAEERSKRAAERDQERSKKQRSNQTEAA